MMEKQTKTLPRGWVETELGDVCTIRNGYAFKSKDFKESGVPLIRQSNLTGKEVDLEKCKYLPDSYLREYERYIVSNGDILLGMSGSIGEPSIYKSLQPALQNQRTGLLQTNIETAFIRFFLEFSHNILMENSKGMAVQNISAKDIENMEFWLPPINEQKRIVDKIETLFSDLDKGEENLRTAQRQLTTYRQSVLKAAMSGELIGADSGAWPKQSLGELITDIRYGTAKKCWHDPSKTAVLRIPNVVSGKIDLTNLKHTDFEPAEIKKLALKEGDVLLVRSNGSASLVGRSAVVGKEAEGCAYAGYLIRLRLKQDQILPNFLHLFLLSPGTRAHIERQARSTSGVHNINSDEVKSLSLSLPSIDEQLAILDKIEDTFSRVSVLEAWCATELTRSVTLRQSILKAAFSGQLVPQDSSDEPASELLKRIQAERASTPKAKPTAKRGRNPNVKKRRAA